MADEDDSIEFTPEELFENKGRDIEDLELPDQDRLAGDDVELLNDDQGFALALAFARYFEENPREIEPTEEVDPDEMFLDPEYLEGNPGAGIRIDRLENSVQALLRKNAERSARRMLATIREDDSTGPEIRRKTPVRKAMSFSKEELRFLIAVMNSVGMGETDFGDKARAQARKLFTEFTALHRNWEDEAHNNGEYL